MTRENSALRIPRETGTTCTPEGHTLCLTASEYVNSSASGVTDADKQFIVNKHNTLRANVDPPATDMMKMVWDDRLAAVAQSWANQCPLMHDTDAQRYIEEIGLSVGQNMAMGQSSWEAAVQGWYNEVKDFKYGLVADTYLAEGKMIGHYTQVVQRGSYLIGCGYAYCSISYKKFYICNYAGPNWDTTKPYTSGTTCAACPNQCKDGLCDCDGRICLNGGKLNIESCQCICPELFGGVTCQTALCNGKTCENGGTLDTSTCTCNCKSPYGGDTCTEKNCPAEDIWYCGGHFTYTDCKKYSNIPVDCPYMCGVCKK